MSCPKKRKHDFQTLTLAKHPDPRQRDLNRIEPQMQAFESRMFQRDFQFRASSRPLPIQKDDLGQLTFVSAPVGEQIDIQRPHSRVNGHQSDGVEVQTHLLAMTATPSAADIGLLARENRRRQLAALANFANRRHSYKRLGTLLMKARRPRRTFVLKGSRSCLSTLETT